MTSIGEYAFSGCDGLTSITIPNSVTSIKNGTFKNCKSLNSVTIPNSVTSIGDQAFSECYGLTSVHITDIEAWCNIQIGNTPFNKAHNLYLNGEEIKDLVIPNGVSSISKYAFSGCNGLTSITIPNSVTSIGEYAFSGCDGLTSITIPNSVTSIGEYAFSGCDGLTSITIPNSVTSIKNGTFTGCKSLNSVTIPNSVTSIGEYAFNGCTDLITVFSLIENPSQINFYFWPTTFSEETLSKAILYVPVGCLDKYKSTYGWRDFKNIKEGTEPNNGGGETPEVKKCATPTIGYQNGKLTFNCETEGAVCQYTITNNDVRSGSSEEIQLGVTYNISVYAKKSGYEDSDVAKATLCWIDENPKIEGVTNGVANVRARAVLIQNNDSDKVSKIYKQ